MPRPDCGSPLCGIPRFLQTIHERWSRIEGASDEVIPNIHPDRRTASYPRSAVGQAGFHQADTSCPIAAGTWEAAYWSAQSAVHGADLMAAGEQAAYVLSRPPGHHAFADLAGGFCFLNNSGIAAERLLKAGKRPAILDIDVHHGNGTQGIFYERGDVLTVSLHADPVRFYPFFWGHGHERGEGAGRGCNLNLPLARGTGDDEYLKTLETAFDTFGHSVPIFWLLPWGSMLMKKILSRGSPSPHPGSDGLVPPSRSSACRCCSCRKAVTCRKNSARTSPVS